MWNKILTFLHIKKKKQVEVASNGLLVAEPEVRPEYVEGYCCLLVISISEYNFHFFC